MRQKIAGAFVVKGDNVREEGVMLMANQGQLLYLQAVRGLAHSD